MSGMPQTVIAFDGWTKQITLGVITQQIINGFPVDTQEDIYFNGTIQPLSPRKIALKPEGQRSWEWLQIHCLSSGAVNLQPNDRVVYMGQKYKIMANNDYSLNGYIEYQLIRDFQDE